MARYKPIIAEFTAMLAADPKLTDGSRSNAVLRANHILETLAAAMHPEAVADLAIARFDSGWKRSDYLRAARQLHKISQARDRKSETGQS